MNRLPILLIVVGLLSMVRGTSEAMDDNSSAGDCFRAADIVDWGALGRRGLILKTNDDRAFAVEIIGLCPDLRYARVVNFKSAEVELCGHPGESIRVERQTCYLDHMRVATEEERKALRAPRP